MPLRAPSPRALLSHLERAQPNQATLLLARKGVEVNKHAQSVATALILASQNGHVEVVLLAHPDVEANRTSTDGRSALCVASRSGHGAIVSLLVAHRAHGQVRLLAADAINSLPADLFKELPGVVAQAAALSLPLDVAAALGDTEGERAAADVPASQSASLEAANAELAVVQTPEELALAHTAWCVRLRSRPAMLLRTRLGSVRPTLLCSRPLP